MNFLMNAWSYFATNILQQPAFMIGLIVMLGYILQKKPWYDVLAGVIKAIVGYLILTVGSGGLVSNFRPVLVGLKDVFQIDAMVIDPYFGQNAVTAGVEEVFGKGNPGGILIGPDFFRHLLRLQIVSGGILEVPAKEEITPQVT